MIRKSEPILEYRTIEGDDNENPRDYQFVVQTEIKKKSQYELQSGTEIERRTIDKYLEMNKSKIRRLDEVNKYYLRKDAKNYRKIKFVASKPKVDEQRLSISSLRLHDLFREFSKKKHGVKIDFEKCARKDRCRC